MKFLFVLLLSSAGFCAVGQNIQLHYDLRHSVDPKNNPSDFPTLYFEYFKNQDSGKSLIKPGSFLIKLQADLLGEKSNIGKAYMQVSQSFRCWTPHFFVNLQYSGGLGLTEPRQYSYYIQNTYSIGISYPFQWRGAWLSAVLNYKYVPYEAPTQDPLLTLYWWKGYLNYRFTVAGDFSIWTENKNHGDAFTKNLIGKQFYFFAEPQFWYSINKVVESGIKLNTYYHVLLPDNKWQVYPAIAIKCKL